METAQTQKQHIEKELTQRCKTLETRLDRATEDKETVFKEQMNQIQSNFANLVEQISVHNQSVMDNASVSQLNLPDSATRNLRRILSPACDRMNRS